MAASDGELLQLWCRRGEVQHSKELGEAVTELDKAQQAAAKASSEEAHASERSASIYLPSREHMTSPPTGHNGNFNYPLRLHRDHVSTISCGKM